MILAFGASLAACLVIFTDLFWFRNQSFMWHHDAEIPFEDIFVLISNFFQGGVQLFDRYDGMNFAYNHLGHGLYTVANIVTACVYVVLSPFFIFPGEAYHGTYSLVFHATNILIRTLGGYILLRKFKLSPPVITIALVMLNTFLSSTMYLGFVANNLYSYFPLLAYFILNFFETFRLKDFLSILLVLTIAVAGSPLLALGYFYQNLNFLMIVCLGYALVANRFRLPLKGFSGLPMRKIIILLGMCALILIPSMFMIKLLGSDFYVEGSGLSGTQGRLSHMFNPAKYFAPKGETILPMSDFSFKTIDFTNAAWEKSWTFWGASVVILSWLGLVCCAYRQKYIFAITAALVLLTNTPLSPLSPLAIAHWINALTHPFSFLLRSYHMPVLLLPYVIFPLVAFGLQVSYDLIKGKSSPQLPWFTALCLAGLFLAAWFLPLSQKLYVGTMLGIALGFVYMLSGKGVALGGSQRAQAGALLMIIFFVIDAWALREYYNNNQYHGSPRDRGGYLAKNDGRHVKPYIYEGFEDPRPLILEYQNPKILPFREYFRILPTRTDPYLHTDHGHYGAFYRYMPLERYFVYLDIYMLRPKIYKDWALNTDVYQSLAQNQRVIGLAQSKVDGPWQTLPERTKRYDLSLAKARLVGKKDFKMYLLKLPAGFPKYESTAMFTLDRNRFMLLIEGKEFLPVQGALTEPFSFDVNNVKDGYLALSVPKGMELQQANAALTLTQSGDVLDIWKNTDDALGFTFLAGSDGWLNIRYPYDPKWQASVDGKPVPIKNVGGYFLGLPLTTGEHKVLLRYWPNSPLRLFIVLSVILTFLGLIYAFAAGLRETARQ